MAIINELQVVVILVWMLIKRECDVRLKLKINLYFLPLFGIRPRLLLTGLRSLWIIFFESSSFNTPAISFTYVCINCTSLNGKVKSDKLSLNYNIINLTSVFTRRYYSYNFQLTPAVLGRYNDDFGMKMYLSLEQNFGSPEIPASEFASSILLS